MIADLIFGVRHLRRHLSMAAVCVLVLGIGIGAATAVFTVLYDAILKPLPYRDPDRLVAVANQFPQSPLTRTAVSGPDFVDLAARRDVFSDAAAYFFNDFTMTGTAYAEHVDAVNASASLFPLLGIPVDLGRTFTIEEERAGAKVVVLSDSLWRGTFGGDPHVVGRRIALDHAVYEIVGVMPPQFEFPYPATQMWVPLSLSPARLAARERGRQWLQMVARLAPSVTPERANAALLEVSRAFATEFPDVYPERTGWRFWSRPIAAQQTDRIRNWIILAFGAVLSVLLIACSNASGLLLVHTTVRQREWAVRASLGATPARLFRQLFTETGLLAVAACVVAVAFAAGAVRLINALGPIRPSAIGPWTYAFAIVVAVGSALLTGIVPAARLLRLPLDRSLKAGDLRVSTGRSGWRNVLVAGQIAIAMALVFTATALTRSFINLLDVPLGFSAERMWTAAVQLPDRGPSSGPASAAFFQTLTARIAALPGVEAATAGQMPFNPSGLQVVDLKFPGRPTAPVRPAASLSVVLPNYFSTLRIALVGGRTFSDRDGAATNAVAVVDRAFVQRYFPSDDPIGKLVARDIARDRPYTIVGVVATVASGELGEAPVPHVYLSALQFGASATYLVVRQAPGQDVTAMVRDQLREMDANVALFDVGAMDARVARTVRVRRFVAWLVGGFAIVGVLLAALGLYGTLAHAAALRRREIAIRLAVGAWPGSVRAMVARHGVSIAFAGLVPGILMAMAAARVTRSFLFGVGFFDAWTMAGAPIGLVALAVLASWIPAARAASADPLAALREE